MLLNFKRAAGAITVAVLAATATIGWAADAAKDYPNKPVRLIGPFTPGAGTDTRTVSCAQADSPSPCTRSVTS